jgi:hypothetical protein
VIVLAKGRVVFDGLPHDLATVAAGKVWEVKLPFGQDDRLPDGAMVVDQVPEQDDTVRTRIISETSPHQDARSVEASLEDGYLLLAGQFGKTETA